MIKELNIKYNIILASGSPRRKELMQKAGYHFEVITANVDESFLPGIDPQELVLLLSKKKANAVAEKINEPKTLIIAADTIVVNEKTILGKPVDLEDAKTMLQNLSNKSHQVITGVCIYYGDNALTFSSSTEVILSELSIQEIDHYCNNFEVLDKAGAYAIQDWIGLNKVKTIKGCYYNVMGLPLSLLYEKLEELLNAKNSTLT